MDKFFLAIIAFLLIAFVVYIIASIRIERRARSNREATAKRVGHGAP